jgi:hypothetical protein
MQLPLLCRVLLRLLRGQLLPHNKPLFVQGLVDALAAGELDPHLPSEYGVCRKCFFVLSPWKSFSNPYLPGQPITLLGDNG